MQVPDRVTVQRNRLSRQYQLFQRIMQENTHAWNNRISRCSYALENAVRQKVTAEQTSLQRTEELLHSGIQHSLDRRRDRFAKSVGLLDALSPLAVLSRGYSVAMKGETAVRRIEDVEIGDTVTVRLTDGILITETKGKSEL